MNKYQVWAIKQSELIKNQFEEDFDQNLIKIAANIPYQLIQDKTILKLSKQIHETIQSINNSISYMERVKAQREYNAIYDKIQKRLVKTGLHVFGCMQLIENMEELATRWNKEPLKAVAI
jgi:hypothetical protein